MVPEICIYPPPIGSPRNLYCSLASPTQLNFKMGSIPGASKGVDINYNKHGDQASLRSSPGSPFSPTSSPSSPCTSWEESMMQLSRDLQIICRSPDRYDMPVFPPSSVGCGGGVTLSGPTSPTMTLSTTASGTMNTSVVNTVTTTSSPSVVPPSVIPPTSEVVIRDMGKLLSIRHVQSEEKLREKLSNICRSPRRSRSSLSSGSDSDSGKLKPTKMTASGSSLGVSRTTVSGKRRAMHAFPYFKTNVDIGNHTIEDLSVHVEAHQLKVFSERKSEGSKASRGDLPVIIDLPTDVNPQKLICIVRDGVLEVKESKRKCPQAGKVLGRQLSMSCTTSGLRSETTRRSSAGLGSVGCAPGRHNTEQCPIVIEDDGSHLLKLVLRVPPGYKFEDIQIKTVDNQLLVSGRRGPQRSLSASYCPPSWDKENSGNSENFFTNIFELPASVDPFSITARLTDQHQLIIQATLSIRTRSNTM